MNLAPEELQKIAGFVQAYKAMPTEKRAQCRDTAKRLSIWQGAQPHVREVNAELLNRLFQAEYEIKAAQVAQPITDDPKPPTTAEVLQMVKPLAVAGGAIVGVAAAGYVAFSALMGIGAAVCAFFTSYGGILIGAGFAVFCLSALVGGNKGKAMEVETKQEKRQVNINIVIDGEQQNVKVG